MFDRSSYWHKNWDVFFKSNSIFNYPYVKSILLEDNIIQDLRNLSFSIVANSCSLDQTDPVGLIEPDKLISILKNTTSFSIKKDLDSFVKLEGFLVNFLEKNGLLEQCVGIEFPVNLRVIHSVPETRLIERQYATHRVHCDPWAGEPTDCINCFIYIDLDQTSSTLGLLLPDDQILEKLEKFKGVYEEAVSLIENLNPLNYKSQIGQFIVFDSYVPHWTKFGTNSIRISIDFRLRRLDPYKVLDERWNNPLVPWSKYWYFPMKKPSTFDERLKIELFTLQEKGMTKAGDFRRLEENYNRYDKITKIS